MTISIHERMPVMRLVCPRSEYWFVVSHKIEFVSVEIAVEFLDSKDTCQTLFLELFNVLQA